MIKKKKLSEAITNESIAKSIGVLLGNLQQYPFMKRINRYDLNDHTLPSGIYGINTTNQSDYTPENNTSGIPLGVAIIFEGNGLSLGGNPVVQIVIDYLGNSIRYRTWFIDHWNEWKTINTK